MRRGWLIGSVAVLLLALGVWGVARAIGSSPAEPAADKAGADHPADPPKEEHPPSEEPDLLSVLFHHVQDSNEWVLFESFGPNPLIVFPRYLEDTLLAFGMTKFKVLIAIAALAMAACYLPLARRMRNGEPVNGPLFNFLEALLTFVRDEIAKPNLGGGSHAHSHGEHEPAHGDHGEAQHGHEAHAAPAKPANLGEHPADKYVPLLWTIFLFVLFCNLLGMFPFAGSPTGSIFVTGALGLVVLFAIPTAAIAKMGFVPYLKSLWPPMDIPIPVAGFGIKLFIMGIETMGLLIKCSVLAVRLFANMFAGHMVIATMLYFIVMAQNTPALLWGTITVGSVGGVVAMSLLELFVAFLQAYIFTFLTSLFMGMAINPEH